MKPSTNRPLRRLSAILAVFLGAALFVGGTVDTDAAEANEPAQRPNILFIMSDDHASHAMSCYGSKINQTPNLDRIATEGMRFENCFCTNSICGPSRAVILTGKYSHLNGFLDNRNETRFDGSQQTVAKLLQKAGYQTAMIGKWHLRSDPTGFDYWHILPGQGVYYDPPMIEMGEPRKHTGYTTDIITDITLDFLKNKRDKDKPFFVMYHHKAPHRSWQPGPNHETLYDDRDIPEPETFNDDYSGRGTAAAVQEMTIEHHLKPFDVKEEPPAGLTGQALKKWKYQRYIKDYLRCVASVDDNVGRVLEYLDESGLADNTVVIYTSDQGFFLGDHGWFDKRFMYEHSLRIPLVVRWPKHVKPGSVNSDIVLNLDFAETFLAIAGAPIPDDMQGRSLVPLLDGHTPDDWRQSMYYRYYEYPAVHMAHKQYGVRTDRYKLIYFNDLDEWELYDLEEDPNELNSVYDDPAYASVVTELKAELARLKEYYGDDDTVTGAEWKGSPERQRAKAARIRAELARTTVVPVSGQVSIDGKPLPHGCVRFLPEHGRPASAEIQSDGRYTLTT
ncbi:MAG: sulfatase, partial [Pirellulaceae bacterium]|nr:sulfatase [Pirellulaceae bacterium]